MRRIGYDKWGDWIFFSLLYNNILLIEKNIFIPYNKIF